MISDQDGFAVVAVVKLSSTSELLQTVHEIEDTPHLCYPEKLTMYSRTAVCSVL